MCSIQKFIKMGIRGIRKIFQKQKNRGFKNYARTKEVDMITKISFRCDKCGKEFAFKGHWYNRMLIEWWSDVRWVLHCMAKHHEKPNKKDVLYIIKLVVAFILLFPLQIFDIIATPFRHL